MLSTAHSNESLRHQHPENKTSCGSEVGQTNCHQQVQSNVGILFIPEEISNVIAENLFPSFCSVNGKYPQIIQ